MFDLSGTFLLTRAVEIVEEKHFRGLDDRLGEPDNVDNFGQIRLADGWYAGIKKPASAETGPSLVLAVFIKRPQAVKSAHIDYSQTTHFCQCNPQIKHSH